MRPGITWLPAVIAVLVVCCAGCATSASVMEQDARLLAEEGFSAVLEKYGIQNEELTFPISFASPNATLIDEQLQFTDHMSTLRPLPNRVAQSISTSNEGAGCLVFDPAWYAGECGIGETAGLVQEFSRLAERYPGDTVTLQDTRYPAGLTRSFVDIGDTRLSLVYQGSIQESSALAMLTMVFPLEHVDYLSRLIDPQGWVRTTPEVATGETESIDGSPDASAEDVAATRRIVLADISGLAEGEQYIRSILPIDNTAKYLVMESGKPSATGGPGQYKFVWQLGDHTARRLCFYTVEQGGSFGFAVADVDWYIEERMLPGRAALAAALLELSEEHDARDEPLASNGAESSLLFWVDSTAVSVYYRLPRLNGKSLRDFGFAYYRDKPEDAV